MDNNVIKFPVELKKGEEIRYINMSLQPHFVHEGIIEFKIDVYTNREEYHAVEHEKLDILESAFDRILKRMAFEIKEIIKD